MQYLSLNFLKKAAAERYSIPINLIITGDQSNKTLLPYQNELIEIISSKEETKDDMKEKKKII